MERDVRRKDIVLGESRFSGEGRQTGRIGYCKYGVTKPDDKDERMAQG
jgi:hypothetical protein